ncbi:protein PHYTOCHROME KINASE SUBSTRATE 3-like [Helianthus annuus]|uniref:protein PHYTOCHROME KINASE SUBSTRATE 3-like n=1 Tax=Helianthus annuus TaxID=4232 RepID=UPI000B903022|nr:protein PHYTOCHROME KINASE SUBSTRATE 3-like [Helianthus annuus]
MATENNIINDLRVASFSCYLKPIEDVVNMFDANERFSNMAKPSIFTARTPSIGSQTRCYSNNREETLLNQKSSSGKRWFHGCKAPCSTKKAVYVQQSIKKGDQFTFPVMINPTMEIEVFGSGTLTKGDIAKTLVKKMSTLTWDAIPKSKESVVCDDMASEASSDLFEIDNLSRTEWQPSESRFMSPSAQRALSEAGIEWRSCVTASGVDFSSVYSCFDEKQMLYNTKAKTKIEQPKASSKKLNNGMLGCSGSKSVKVVEPVYRTTDKSNIRYI